jgi:hypothetical protein
MTNLRSFLRQEHPRKNGLQFPEAMIFNSRLTNSRKQISNLVAGYVHCVPFP